MNEQDRPAEGGARAVSPGHGAAIPTGDVVAHEPAIGTPERFENPGLPAHVHRLADTDEKAAKRAEKQVAGLFLLSILGTLLFLVAYFMFGTDEQTWVPGIGRTSVSNVLLGTGLGLSLLGIGLGAVHWAKTLMPDTEVIEERHPLRSSDEARAGFVQTLTEGGEGAQLKRRPMVKYTFGAAMGLFAIPLLVQVVGSLGPMGEATEDLRHTYWNGKRRRDGSYAFSKPRLVRDPENTPIRASDVTIGSVFHVQPEGLLDEEHHVLDYKAKASVIVMRLDPKDIKSQKELDWGHEGIVAYSKICTHVGCPVGLYEQTTHHLLCPCHQSTFDVTDDCKVVFGPAKRPLPQLPITVDDEGYLIAEKPFQEPVGPSFWEREK